MWNKAWNVLYISLKLLRRMQNDVNLFSYIAKSKSCNFLFLIRSTSSQICFIHFTKTYQLVKLFFTLSTHFLYSYVFYIISSQAKFSTIFSNLQQQNCNYHPSAVIYKTDVHTQSLYMQQSRRYDRMTKDQNTQKKLINDGLKYFPDIFIELTKTETQWCLQHFYLFLIYIVI